MLQKLYSTTIIVCQRNCMIQKTYRPAIVWYNNCMKQQFYSKTIV